MGKRKWEYKVTNSIGLPPADKRTSDPSSPISNCADMEFMLNAYDEDGWELVTYGEKHWVGRDYPQSWWIFRRPHNQALSK